jgi:cytochrome c-type biogenesis protein CcmH/NrfG
MEKIEDLKEAVRLKPNNLAAWLRLGNIYFDYGRYREAIKAYHNYLSLKPDDPDIRTNMGIMLRGLGDDDGAIEEFRKATLSDPKHANSRFQLGLVLLQNKKDVQEAILAWKAYLKVELKGERANWVRNELKRLETTNP